MQAIHDQTGRVVGWMFSDVIIDLHALPRAFVRKGQVVSYNGRHLGRLDNGFFRDLRGAPVAFMRGAQGGPAIPVAAKPPVAPVPPVPPVQPVPPVAPVAPAPLLGWGGSWDEFLG